MNFILIFLIGIMDSGNFCPGKKKQNGIPFGTWMHSHEEEKNPDATWKLYRPAAYAFPPSRGRSGFVILKNGRFALLGPSPSDRSDTVWGTWKKEAAGRLGIVVSGTELKQLSWRRAGKDKIEAELK